MMLILWLKLALGWLAERAQPAHYARISTRGRCPACGHRGSILRTKLVRTATGAEKKAVVHTCCTCDAEYAEEPLHPERLS